MKLQLTLLLSAFALLSLSGCRDGNHFPQTQNLFSINPEDTTRSVACYRIPSISVGPDGVLLAVVDERVPSCGDLKWNGNINLLLRRSEDGGKTWDEPRRIVDFPEGCSASDPSMVYDPETETVFLFYNYMDLNNAKDKYFFHVLRSRDGGLTWSETEDITSQVSPQEWKDDFKFITSGQGTVTSDGRMLHTIVNLSKGLHIFGSNDHGKSWYLLPVALTPADESKIIALPDGTWMVNSRVNGQGYRHLHISTDNGANWNSIPCEALLDPGCNAATAVHRYKGQDYLLFVNAADPEHRRNLTLRYSTDNGNTWSEGLVIYEGNAAYSDITVLPDGTIVILYEKDNYTKITVTTLPFSSLL